MTEMERLAAQIPYKEEGDFLVPDIFPEIKNPTTLGRYARMRLAYIKENKEMYYIQLYRTGQILQHLHDTQRAADEREEQLIEQMKQREGVTEELKRKDQMLWVQKMNNIRSRVQEMVIDEIVNN